MAACAVCVVSGHEVAEVLDRSPFAQSATYDFFVKAEEKEVFRANVRLHAYEVLWYPLAK